MKNKDANDMNPLESMKEFADEFANSRNTKDTTIPDPLGKDGIHAENWSSTIGKSTQLAGIISMHYPIMILTSKIAEVASDNEGGEKITAQYDVNDDQSEGQGDYDNTESSDDSEDDESSDDSDGSGDKKSKSDYTVVTFRPRARYVYWTYVEALLRKAYRHKNRADQPEFLRGQARAEVGRRS